MCVLSTPPQQASYKDHMMRFETLICMSLSAGLFKDEETQARTGPRENLVAPTLERQACIRHWKTNRVPEAMSLQQPLQNK